MVAPSNTVLVLHGGGRRVSLHRTLAELTACGQHHNGLVSSASWPLTNRAHKTTATTLLHTDNRVAAKETSELCAHAFIGWVTLSQEPAREGRGLRSLSGSRRRLITLIGVGGPSMGASQEWAGLGGGRRKAERKPQFSRCLKSRCCCYGSSKICSSWLPSLPGPKV